MSSGEESGVTTYNHDAAVELAQAEAFCREWLPFSRDGEAICWVMVEYDRRAAEIEELRVQRAAVLALHQAVERAFANGDTREMCVECDVYWPCPTVQALGVEA